MARDLRNHIRKCSCCKKFEAAPPIAPLKPLACSGPGELLHVDFTSIEETVPLHQEPVIRNVMVMQDHFSKYVVAYVVKDQMACTATETLRNGYFGLFGAPTYLVSDQGKAFTGHLISNLCELYGVQKLMQSAFFLIMQTALYWFSPLAMQVATCICCPKGALVLGNVCERLCASRPLLGSYVHQESM